jgi:hypothetical protein
MDREKMEKIPPPYNINAEDCDIHNPNIWDEKVWQDWLNSIDYFSVNYEEWIQKASLCIISTGHRGIRIVDKETGMGDWYYDVEMGYKA